MHLHVLSPVPPNVTLSRSQAGAGCPAFPQGTERETLQGTEGWQTGESDASMYSVRWLRLHRSARVQRTLAGPPPLSPPNRSRCSADPSTESLGWASLPGLRRPKVRLPPSLALGIQREAHHRHQTNRG